jgi:hypothetical protein
MNHIGTGRALSLRGELLPPYHGSQQSAMNMVVDSMEMALGAIPHPNRVPEHRLLSPKTHLRWRRCCRTFRGWILIDLGFLHRRQFIGGRARSEGTRGAHTKARHGQGRAILWCGCLGALLRLCFGLCLLVG